MDTLTETLELMLEIAEITDNINAAERSGELPPEAAEEARRALVDS
mgnify:CR=1 FL=1